MIAGRFDEDKTADELIMREYDKPDGFDEDNSKNDDEREYEAMPYTQHKKPKDSGFNFLVAQVVMCVMALLIIFALKAVGGYYYNYAKSVFDECFNTPINKSQVLGASAARAVVAAQSTVYGMGGESADDNVKHIEDKSKLTDAQSKALYSVNQMMLPVNSTTLTCKYGWRIHPVTGKQSFHTGIDIGEDSGKPIYTALDGVVKKTVTDDPDYGNYVVITHANGIETMYAHSSKLNCKAGQSVKKGDVIAYVGTTGLSTGPHLHFEVRINDTRLNPLWFIKL